MKPRPPSELPTIERLRECFHYNQETGVLTWKVRPRDHFRTARGYCIFNALFPGETAGSLDHNGYLIINMGGRAFKAHRIAWALGTGAWPTQDLDHKNGVKTDNQLSNLRLATTQANNMNVGRKGGISGVKGVFLAKGKWRVLIQVDKKLRHFGYFESREKAKAVARSAREQLHGEFARHE